MSERDIRTYLIDILDCLKKIEDYIHGMSYEDFLQDDKTKDAILRNLEVIGEAVKNIPEPIKTKYPDVEWESAAGMRDRLIHEYFGVSFPIVWETIKQDLPILKRSIEAILKEIEEDVQ